VVWVLIVGVLIGIGKLIMIVKNGQGKPARRPHIPHWFAAQRTPNLTAGA